MRLLLAFCLFALVSAHFSNTVDDLEQFYRTLQDESCTKVLAKVPAIPTADADAFMKAYQKFTGTGPDDEAAVLKLANVVLSRSDVTAFLGLPDSFQAGGLDADMVTCAVVSETTPKGMAEFAAQGQAEEALVTKMLSDTLLMRDMLVAGGAREGKFTEAMAIYAKLIKASAVLSRFGNSSRGSATFWDDRSQDKTKILHRLAVGIAVENAVPIPTRYAKQNPTRSPNVDPVARYLHYERAYLAGDLDPYFEVLTGFEFRHAADGDAYDEDLTWIRTTMAIYRPDNIVKGHPWRYSQAVHSDVSYGKPKCDDMPGICTGRYAQIPAADGECGPRAFFGRIVRKAFGMPTWGVTQPGHAAMSTWNPADGWHVLLGAAWQHSYWNKRQPGRGGPDFVLETQCRELRPAFQKVLRGGWVAKARGEQPVDMKWSPRTHKDYGTGGLWGALMLYFKKLTVASVTIANTNITTIPARPIGPSLVPTMVDALIAKWPKKYPKPTITTDPKTGTITIPAAAYAFKNKSASLSVMKCYFDDKQQVLHGTGNLVDPRGTAFGYEVKVEEAGTYYLTANFSSWHMNQDLRLVTSTSENGEMQMVPMYYTLGYWNESQPIEVKLLKGTNVLTFTRWSTHEIVFKEFFLFKHKPIVPKPPPDYTPSPTPSPAQYIEVADTTTCLLQGIKNVPADLCGPACAILGFTFTGGKARQNMTGCFALIDGQWKGNCNYNTNKSAHNCAHPPCQVEGSTVANLCMRV